jgi:hypothetical protein
MRGRFIKIEGGCRHEETAVPRWSAFCHFNVFRLRAVAGNLE